MELQPGTQIIIHRSLIGEERMNTSYYRSNRMYINTPVTVRRSFHVALNDTTYYEIVEDGGMSEWPSYWVTPYGNTVTRDNLQALLSRTS